MGLYYKCSKYLLFYIRKLQKSLPGYIKKVKISIKVMASSSDYRYYVYQKKYYS